MNQLACKKCVETEFQQKRNFEIKIKLMEIKWKYKK